MGRTWMLSLLMWSGTVLVVCGSEPSSSQLLNVFRYFPDQSFTIRQYACTEPEQRCLNNDTLLHEADGKCYAVGGQGPCQAGEIFHADKAEAERLGGHLRGTCSVVCGDSSKAPLAATGQCMTRAEVEAQVCRSEWYLTASKDAFGQWVCEWTKLPCSPPQHIKSPVIRGNFSHDGVCYAPDFLRQIATNSTGPTDPKQPANQTGHPWLRFFANASYLDREFPCSDEQKLCLQYGRVLHSDGNCYSPRDWIRQCEPGQSFHLDWDEVMRDGGTLAGTCRSRCKGFSSPLAATGECMEFQTVSSQLCRWEWGMHVANDEFGQMVCQCANSYSFDQPPATLPPAASKPGHCRAPNFMNPVRSPMYDRTLTLGFSGVPCTEQEHACLLENRVLAKGACHELRTQGPCADGEELVLDKHALAHARLQTVCKETPCPVGSVRIPIDGRCLTREQAKTVLCPDLSVTLDEFGGWQCDYQGGWPGNFTATTRHAANGTCEMRNGFGHFGQPAGFASGGGVGGHRHGPPAPAHGVPLPMAGRIGG